MCFHEFRNTYTDKVEAVYVLTTVVIIVISVFLLNGCSAASQARQRLDDGDPFAAVELYDRALEHEPGDAELLHEAQRARTQAGDAVADRARAALAQGDYAAALLHARQAIEYDHAHTELDAEIRNTWAQALIAQGQQKLVRAEFDGARRIATQASEVAPGTPTTASFKAQVARAEAAHLEAGAHAFADAGDFERAMSAAQRAAHLTPGAASAAALPDAISVQQREAEFDRLAIKAAEHQRNGRLAAFDRVLESMAALHVREESLAQIVSERDDAIRNLNKELEFAQAAREQGDFAAAMRHYAAANAIGSDFERVRSERAAAESEQLASELRMRAQEAFAQGDYQRAAADFEQALHLDADAPTEALLRQARAAMFRQQLDASLTQGDLGGAITALNQVHRFEPIDNYSEQLDALTHELIESAFTEAGSLHAQGNTGRAILVLERALALSASDELAQLRAHLVAEQFVQLAVAAEQAGDYAGARVHYLNALAAGGDRAGIVQRIDATAPLAELEHRLHIAERDIDELHREVNVRDNLSRSLQLQLHDAEHALRSLHADTDHLRYELECAVRENRSLERMVDDLRRQVRDAQDQARRTEREARQSSYGRPSGQNGRRP